MKKFKRFFNAILGNDSYSIVDNVEGLSNTQRIARDILLNRINPLDCENLNSNNGIDCNSKKTVHAIIVSNFDNPTTDINRLAISLARQTALLCHYPNFDESDGSNRTKITLIDCSSNNNLENIYTLLETETGNLLKYCRWTMYHNRSIYKQNEMPETYIDIEFNIIGGENFEPSCINTLCNENEIVSIFHNNINTLNLKIAYSQSYNIGICKGTDATSIDLRRAKLTNMVHSKGINLVQVKGIDDINEYDRPIKIYCTHTNWRTINKIWEKLPIEHKLSSLFCGDCFESRMRSANGNINKSNIIKLAYTEHARWNVEKLILGYRPYNKEEKFTDNFSYGPDKNAMRNRLKKQEKIHIDICSCSELIRINKEDLKYDFFLTLCIPHIQKREKK